MLALTNDFSCHRLTPPTTENTALGVVCNSQKSLLNMLLDSEGTITLSSLPTRKNSVIVIAKENLLLNGFASIITKKINGSNNDFLSITERGKDALN